MCGPAMPCYTPTPECLCPAQVVPGRTYRTILVSGRNSAQHAAGRGTHMNCGGGPRHPAAAAAAAGLHLTIWLGCVLKAQLLTFSLVHAKMAHRKCRCLLGSAAVHPDLTPPAPTPSRTQSIVPLPSYPPQERTAWADQTRQGGHAAGNSKLHLPSPPGTAQPGRRTLLPCFQPKACFQGCGEGHLFWPLHSK